MLQKQLMLPRGFSRRKLGLSYQQHSQSAGPYQKLSSWQWALSERPSIGLADIDWKYESAPAQSHQLQRLRGIRCNLENQKLSSPERWSRCLANFRMVLSTGQQPQPLPLQSALGRTSLQRAKLAHRRRSTFSGGLLRKRCESYRGKKCTISDWL